MNKETHEQEILRYVNGIYTISDVDSVKKNPYTRKELSIRIKEHFGNEGVKIVSQLWKEGYLMFNSYGYINLSKRGYTLMKKGIKTPKQKNKQIVTLESVLDSLYLNRRNEFEKWLVTKGIIQE